MTAAGLGRRAVLVLSAVLLSGASLRAQSPAAPPASPGQALLGRAGQRPGAGPAGNTLNPEQVQELFDAMVNSRAQGALQLTESQFSAFFQRMLRLQNIQRAHRNQRRRVLAEIRLLVGPKATENADDAAVAAKVKELDDLETQMSQDERKALADIDQVLNPRQRAHFRIFLEMMERQKVDLLIRARQGGGVTPPVAARPGPVIRRN